jgi:CobQ-like glutamine amidotransferase family enzyme
MKQTLKITHLYPKHMSLYGDRGNIVVLSQKAVSQGLEVEVQNCSVGQSIQASVNVVFLGGGQDHDQEKIVKDLLPRKNQIKDLISEGTLFIGVCGGYQLLGEYYEDAAGNYLEGLNVLNFQTKKAKNNEKRIIGNVKALSKDFGELVGFENHGGRTFLSSGLNPLATVLEGGGNNAEDKTEGVFERLEKGYILGTYLHGFLPKNPQVADVLLNLLFAEKADLINDSMESLNKQNALNLRY